MLLFRHGGRTSSSSPPPGELAAVVVAVSLRGEEYHAVAAVEGHELETPQVEQCPGLKRLLEATHLELNGKLFVNTQQAPTWRANCRRFDPGGSLDRRVNLSLRDPAKMGWHKMEHEGETRLVLSRTKGGARSRGYKRSREREGEPVRQLVLPRDPPPPHEGPGPPFYRCKERVQVYNGGCSYALTCLA
jgi:sirohydrochlorin ferrochelatase